MLAHCFLLLGTNMGNKGENLSGAVSLIEKEIGQILLQSGVYESEPWGYADEETYFNLAICIDTNFAPNRLLKGCLNIEERMGRVRSGNGYEARPIDIDIIFIGNEIIETSNLIVPHPRMHERNFVLQPLREICKDFVHPVLKKTVAELANECKDRSWVRKNTPGI